MAKSYGDDSIRSQSAVETCRENLPTFFGSTDEKGARHSIIEILSNAIDEEKVKDVDKRGKVELTIHKDNSITVADEGRGLPLDWNKKENKWNWQNVLLTLHSGGKFADGRDNFKNSTGMNGLGLAVTAMSSAWIKVESRYNGYIYHVELKKGCPTEAEDKVLKKEKDPKGAKQKTGTIISWKCDTDEVYLSDDFDLEALKDWCNTQAILTDGTTVILKDERSNFKQEYKYDDGIKTFAEESTSKDTKFIEFSDKGKGKDSAKFKEYEVNCRVLFAFTDKNCKSYWYHNSLPLTLGGSPQKAEEAAFTEFFQKQTGNKKIEFGDIQENLFFISNTLTQIAPTFRNQTKDAIDMPYIEQFLKGKLDKQLTQWAKDNPLELDKVKQQIIVNQEARLSAGAQRALTKQKLSGKIKLSDKIEKFTECRSKDNEITECFICEGDSAAGTIITARNSEFQAVYALRGKIKNVLKMDISKVLEFPILTNVLKVIGTGIETGKKANKLGNFDINNRRFKRIIIATDQDPDGYGHIVSLCLTMFYKLMPELIKQGYVYVLDTPLFIIDTPDGQIDCFSDIEKEKVVKKYGNKVKKIARFKGLGEFTAQQFKRFLDPATRHLTQFTLNDAKLAEKNFNLMMSEGAEDRQKYIAEHANEYKDLELE